MEQGLFFPSKNGDRKYRASDFTGYFSKLFSNGVFRNNSKNLQVIASATNGLSLIVEAGYGNINGYLYQLSEPKTVVFNIADVSGTAKKGSVVLRMDLTERKMTVEAKGTDDLTRNATVYELMLARILIPGNGKSITQGLIQDTRGDGNVCGFVSSLIDIDPTTLWTQFETDWNEWLTEIKGTVGDDAAANLALEIEKIKNEKYSKQGGVIEGNVEIKSKAIGSLLTIRSTNESNFSNTFMSFYKNSIRKGWFGFGESTNDTLTISNEAGSDINFQTTGNGRLMYKSNEIEVKNDTGWIYNKGMYYRIKNSICYLKGLVKLPKASVHAPVQVFTLPEKYIPDNNLFITLHENAGQNTARLQFNGDGGIYVIGNDSATADYSFDSVSWCLD